MGQMIWDAFFDGHDLTMRNMFSQPKLASEIVATYGCFAFHSGLLANGCPSPADTWPADDETYREQLQEMIYAALNKYHQLMVDGFKRV